MHILVGSLIGVRQKRLELALTQHELAVRAGISSQALSKLERGLAQARPSTLAKLAKALKCKPIDLLGS